MTEQSKNENKHVRVNAELNSSFLLVMDLITVIISLMPGVASFSLTGLFIHNGYASTCWVFPLAPFVLFSSFILIIALIRLCLPKLRPGRYKRELNMMVFSWICHVALARSAKIIGLAPLLQSINTVKFLYWRALGAKVSFNILNSSDLDLVDCSLITIGKNVTIASRVSISCHSEIGNLLYLSPVVIQDYVFIGTSTVIGPGTTIKQGAWIGYGNTFVNQVVEP